MAHTKYTYRTSKKSRCKKGTRRCIYSEKCVTINKTKTKKRCKRDHRKCADHSCHQSVF